MKIKDDYFNLCILKFLQEIKDEWDLDVINAKKDACLNSIIEIEPDDFVKIIELLKRHNKRDEVPYYENLAKVNCSFIEPEAFITTLMRKATKNKRYENQKIVTKEIHSLFQNCKEAYKVETLIQNVVMYYTQKLNLVQGSGFWSRHSYVLSPEQVNALKQVL